MKKIEIIPRKTILLTSFSLLLSYFLGVFIFNSPLSSYFIIFFLAVFKKFIGRKPVWMIFILMVIIFATPKYLRYNAFFDKKFITWWYQYIGEEDYNPRYFHEYHFVQIIRLINKVARYYAPFHFYSSEYMSLQIQYWIAKFLVKRFKIYDRLPYC